MNFKELLCLDSPEIIEDIPYTKSVNNKPWIEKYRPTKLDDIVNQQHIINMLKKSAETGDLPHLLLYGPAGTGKTSTILATARELFGPRVYKKRIIELNASDERGINIVRNKIVKFAKMAPCSHDPKYKNLSYKIIILDEADAMTTEAQSALRKVMEDYSDITRFCFICNYIKQIIEPINSRCVKFRFKPISDSDMVSKLKNIAIAEKINIDDDALDEIVLMARGDMRKAIMYLQNCRYLDTTIVNKDDIKDITGHVPDKIMNLISKICINIDDINIKKVYILSKKIHLMGYPIENIISQISRSIVYSDKLTDKQKSLISTRIAETDVKLIDGADEYIQLLSILTFIQKISSKKID